MNAKKIIAGGVLVLGLTTSIFVMSDSRGKQLKKGGVFNVFTSAANKNPQLNFQLTSRLNQAVSISNIITDEAKTNNLTELLAQNYLKDVFNKNAGNGTITKETPLKMPTLDTVGENLQQITSQNINYRHFESEDIKILKGGSGKQQQKEFLESVDSILRKNFSWLKKDLGVLLEETVKKNNPENLNKLIEAIPEFLNDLLELETPKSLEVVQLELLNLWQKKLAVYKAIADMKSDPLKGYIGLKEIPEIVEEDLNLQAVMINLYKELNK